MNKESRIQFSRSVKQEYDNLRESHKKRKEQKKFVSINKARKKKLDLGRNQSDITKPSLLGNKFFIDFPLEDIRKRLTGLRSS